MKIKIYIRITAFALVFSLLASCSPRSAPLEMEPPLPNPQKITRVGGGYWPFPGFGGNLTGAQVGDPGFYIYESLFVNIRGTDEIIPRLAVSAEHGDKTTTVYLRQDVYWNDGVKFTAKDLWCYYYLMNFESGITYQFTDVLVVDEYTLELHWSDPVPSELSRQLSITGDWNAVAPYHLFGEFADRAYEVIQSVPIATENVKAHTFGRDLGNPDYARARSQLTRNVNDYKGVDLDLPVGTGPYMVDRVTNSECILVVNPLYYDKDNLTFEQIHMINVADFGSLLSVSGLDSFVGTFAYDMSLNILAMSGEMVMYPLPETRCVGVLFNHERDYFGDVVFRQALNYVIDKRPVREVGNFWAVETKYSSLGLLPTTLERYVSPEVIDKMTVYERDHDKAAELLTSIGWVKTGDTWNDPSGQTPDLVIAANAGWGSQGINVATEIAHQLTSFGIPTEARAADATVVVENMRDGQYDMLVDFMDQTWSITDPMRTLEAAFTSTAPNCSLDGYTFNLLDWDGLAITYQSADGFINTTSAAELASSLKYINDMEARQQLVDRMVWSLNEFAMGINLYQNVMSIWENARTQENLPMIGRLSGTNRVMPLPETPEEYMSVAALNREYAHHALRFVEGVIRPAG